MTDPNEPVAIIGMAGRFPGARSVPEFWSALREGRSGLRTLSDDELRAAGVSADFLAKAKPKITAQFTAGERDEVPFAVILGESELKEGLVTVKEQKWHFVNGIKEKVQHEDKGTKVKREELVEWIKSTQTFKEWSTGKLISS